MLFDSSLDMEKAEKDLRSRHLFFKSLVKLQMTF